MTAHLLRTSVPEIWSRLGEQFHQDWAYPVTEGTATLEQTLIDTFAGFSLEQRGQLAFLITDLLANATSTGDLKRAWRLAGPDILIPGESEKWYEMLLAAIETVESETA